MSEGTKEQIAAIRETRWQLEAALNLSVGLGLDERNYRDWSDIKEAALVQAAAYLIAQNYQRLITDEKASIK